MPPKQATLGYVKDPQTTLGCVCFLYYFFESFLMHMLLVSKFFGQPNGTKPPAKQSKLSFSSKSAAKQDLRSSNSSKENEDVEMKNEESETEVKPKVEMTEDADAKGNVKPEKCTEFGTSDGADADGPAADTKKRSRSPTPTTSIKSEKLKVKQEAFEEEEEDDDDDEPVLKRPRRNGKAEIEETKHSSSTPKPAAKAEPAKKSKTVPPPPKNAERDEEEGDDEVVEVGSKSNTAKQLDSSASASASEVEEGVEEDEEEEDDEDEKPEVAAKAREKMQTTLKSKAKDPYPDWKPGEPVPYAALCTTFSLIEMTTKRLVIISHCSLFLRQVLRLTPEDLLPTVLLMVNKLAADYAGIELGIGESLIMKAIGESTGRSLAVIKQDQKEIGDLGLVAVKSRANQPTMFKPKPLTVRGVHKGLMDIATVTGNGAQGRKVDLIKKLLSAADGHTSGKVDITKDKGGPSEAKYVVRFLEGKLRLGLAEKSVLVALAQAMVCHEIEAQSSGKVPSTEQLANGEAIVKAVYK
jgi:DNA ligase-1